MGVGDLRTVSTAHATDQALVRVGCLREHGGRGNASRWVEWEALRALQAGRKAKSLPRFCVADAWFQYRPRLSAEGTWRFLWTEAEDAVLLARYTRGRGDAAGKSVWLVITVMTPKRGRVEG